MTWGWQNWGVTLCSEDLLASTGGLIVMMVYYVSGSGGNFFRFWAFMPFYTVTSVTLRHLNSINTMLQLQLLLGIFLGYFWSGRTSGVSLVIFRTEMFHIFYRAILHNVYFDSQCNVHIKIWVHGWYTSKLLPSKCWGELSQHTCTCKLCDLMFGTNGGLYNHMARSHKRYKQ